LLALQANHVEASNVLVGIAKHDIADTTWEFNLDKATRCSMTAAGR
jgi:hypothetical protein